MAVATISLFNGKWTAMYNGQVICASGSREYVEKGIASGRNAKANKYGITHCVDANGMSLIPMNQNPVLANSVISIAHNDVQQVIEEAPTSKFSIAERFEMLAQFTRAIIHRDFYSLTVVGTGGLGKTHTINRVLTEEGLVNYNVELGKCLDSENNISDDIKAMMMAQLQSPDVASKQYVIIKGYSSAKALYRLLYQHRRRTIIFDDCTSILKDKNALEILKGALDTYHTRTISWNIEQKPDDELPLSFNFEGTVIFICNKQLSELDEALRTRSICVDLSMTKNEKIERMRQIVESGEFAPELPQEVKIQALEEIEILKDQIGDLSLRSLLMAAKLIVRGGNWKMQLNYLLTEMTM